MHLALLKPKTSPFNNTPLGQLVTIRHVGVLLKGEVLGSSNAKRINNLRVDVEAVAPTVRD